MLHEPKSRAELLALVDRIRAAIEGGSTVGALEFLPNAAVQDGFEVRAVWDGAGATSQEVVGEPETPFA